MAKPHLISEHPISMAELKLELENVKKRDTELNFRANKTEEYIRIEINDMLADVLLKYTERYYIKNDKSVELLKNLQQENLKKIITVGRQGSFDTRLNSLRNYGESFSY